MATLEVYLSWAGFLTRPGPGVSIMFHSGGGIERQSTCTRSNERVNHLVDG